MPEDAREVFLKTIREKALEYGKTGEEAKDGLYRKMVDNGVTITEVNLKEFQDAIAPLYKNNDLKFSPGLKEKLFDQLGM